MTMMQGINARWRRAGLSACAAAILALSATAAFAQKNDDNIYNAEAGKPALGGFYRPVPGLRPIYFVDGKQLPRRDIEQMQVGFPYKSDWAAAFAARQASARAQKPYGEPGGACWPQGVYHDYIGYPSPIEITQTPGRFQIVHERLTQVRRIHTDGRPHLAGDKLVPTSHGDSIGRWEGDTLVVDTIGVRREFSLGFNMPHSEQLHLVERFRKTDADTLAIDITSNDPVGLERPATTTLIYKRSPPGDRTTEDFCVENNRNTPDENQIVTVDMGKRLKYGFDLPDDAWSENAE